MEDDQSIYDLITKLCEKFLSTSQNQLSYSNTDIRKVRSKCYEIILLKKHSCVSDDSENINDPHCQLLAWQFQLMTIYNLPDHAEKLKSCCEKLAHLKSFDDTTTSNILQLLLQLRRVPRNENKIMETTLDKHYSKDFVLNKSSIFTYFDESKFHLPVETTSTLSEYNSELFKLPLKKVSIKISAFGSTVDLLHSRQIKNKKSTSSLSDNNRLEDEGYGSPLKFYQDENNIWELASKEPPSQHRTWETYGSPSSSREPPFLCESGSEAATWLHSLSASFQNLITENYYAKTVTAVPIKQFIKDLKYLLVGMESKTFKCNDKGDLDFITRVCVGGASPTAVESYCNEFLLCAKCYKGLDKLCTPNPFTMNYAHNGYIFLELCESIKRYLSYYRLAALSISDSSHLLSFSERTKQLRNQITVLASICKVGPFAEAGQIPHGVALLNYLYQKVMSLTNKDVIMVLYSVLYPCCQAYFNHFLQQWILEGTVQDPYGEFFISLNPKYVITRGRTYWTRSYTLREDIVPDFIMDFRNDILYCGKAMNLLRLCVPNSPLYLYLVDKHPNIMSCCVTAEQLADLELNNHYYYLEATTIAGPRMILSQAITCSHEKDDIFISLIAKKRATTLTRIELERKKEQEECFKRKQNEMKMLQEQYEEARRLRQAKLSERLEEEIKTTQNDLKMEILHDRIIQEEANHLINYYNELFKQVEVRRHFYEKQIEDLHIHIKDEDNYSNKNVNSHTDQTSVDVSTQDSHVVLSTKEHPETISRSVSTETFFSTTSEEPSDIRNIECNTSDDITSNTSKTNNLETLDIINANIMQDNDVFNNKNDKQSQSNLTALDNFKTAQRNKAKTLSSEYEINVEVSDAGVENAQNINVSILTDAQKNKLKIMSLEYGTCLIDPLQINSKGNTQDNIEAVNLTDAQKNKLKVMSSEYGNVDIAESKEAKANEKDLKKNLPFIRNREIAQQNKLKAMSSELGLTYDTKVQTEYDLNMKPYQSLTEAQKNKLKVLSSEFGYDYEKSNFPSAKEVKQPLSMCEINKNRMISSSDCFLQQDTITNNKQKESVCDNKNFINKSMLTDLNTDNISIDKNSNKPFKWITKKQDKLSLDFTKLDTYKNINNNQLLRVDSIGSGRDVFKTPSSIKSPKFELDKLSPMSVDSTPLSNLTTPTSSKIITMFEKTDPESTVLTETASITVIHEKGFNFEVDKSESLMHLENRKSAFDLGSGIGNVMISKTITAKDALSVSPNCLKLYLQQSISIPLITQIKLVNNELLKYFINDLQYLNHLHSLRNYFFLMDGEFGRNITEGLFEKLYYSNLPNDLINCHTLQVLVSKALDYSTKLQENSVCLSFRINNLPKVFNLGDPDVFDCLSLTYKTTWPLNILFPSETISKYDEVFKFLLKLHRISWVLQNVFQDLKSLVKETVKNETTVVIMSTQYRRLHQCRHVMTHFIQTLQSYVVGEVLQTNWEIFEKNLELVTNFDQLYLLHTNYIKNILFMCLLNQKSAPLRKTLQKIFIVILKFYDYLRSCSWVVEDNVYVHPNFKKLQDIFSNFEHLTQYLFKVGHKVVKSGYQPHLMQLLDMLDINNYYSKRRVNDVDVSTSTLSR